MKKSLSLLLTFALVFGLFANMASAAETPASAGKYLFDAGVIKGNGTDLLLEDTWKRQDLAVLLSRLLGVEPEAKATEKSHTFNDVRGTFYDGYISWAKEKGYMEGSSETKFGFDQLLNNQSFAAVVLRALGVDTTGENYAKVPELAVAAGIVPADTDWSAPAKRGETYVALYTALDTVVGDTGRKLGEILNLPGFEVTVATAISSAVATGAKKLTVTFNGTVDVDKAKITVFNGNNAVNSKAITFSEDKKSAVVEFAMNLPAAEYTVKVDGVTETTLTATVKVEAEKVAKIEFSSDKAALNRADSKIVTVGYKVLNQYNEEINTTTLSATAGKGTATPSNGTLTLSATAPYVLGEKVVVSLVHTSGAFATATVEVSAPAQVASVKIVKLFQKDGAELVAGSTADFRLVLDLKDQYGNSVTSTAYLADDLIITVSNPAAASLAGFNTATNSATFNNNTDIEGSKPVNLALAPNPTNVPVAYTAGTSNVKIISKSTGANDSIDLVVKQNVKVDTLSLTAPSVAAAGDTVNIPYTAIDQFGNAIAHPVNGQVSSLGASGGATNPTFVKDIVKNVTNLQVTLPSAPGTVIITIITGTNKVEQATINVTDARIPTVISGIQNVDGALHKDGGQYTLAAGNIVVKDQYGDNIALPAAYDVKVESSDASKVTVNGTNEGFAGDVVAALAKGSSSITLTLLKNGTAVENSAYTYNLKVVDKADIKSYTATVAGTVYATNVAAYEKDLTVKGELEDGSTVTIPNVTGNYDVNTTSTNVIHTAGKINANGYPFPANTSEVDVTVLVVVDGASGFVTLPVAVKVSNLAPVATTVSEQTNGVATKVDDGLVSVKVADVGNNVAVQSFVRDAVKVVDQYGITLTNDNVMTPSGNIYVSNISNGHTTANLAAGDEFTVAAVTANGKYISFKVIVVS